VIADSGSNFAAQPLTAPRTATIGSDQLDRAVATLLTVLVGMRVQVNFEAPVALLAGLILLPVWAGCALRSRRYLGLVVLAGLAAASGLVLTIAAPTPTSTSTTILIVRTAMLAALAVNTGVLIWAAGLLGTTRLALTFGCGVILGIPFNLDTAQENAWRFTYSLAIAILAVAIADSIGRLWVQLTVLLTLAAIGLVNDSRSNSSFLILTAILLVGQRVFQRRSGIAAAQRRWVGIGLIIASGFALYQLVVGIILEGGFGEVTQQRTQAQIETSGLLILGGRPEIAASTALISRHPLGMGSGVIASGADINAAKESMWAIGYDPNNGYVERFMFGRGIEVHSLLGDLWIWFGLAGAALAALIVISVLNATLTAYTRATLSALLGYLSIRMIWDLLFSPASSALRFLPLTFCLAVCSMSAVRAHEIGRGGG